MTPGRIWCRAAGCSRVTSDEAWTVSGAFRRAGGSAVLAELARVAESVGWDGVVVWGSDRLPGPGTRRGRFVGGAQRHRLGDGHRSARADGDPAGPQAGAEACPGDGHAGPSEQWAP
jgi:hypothetical protein